MNSSSVAAFANQPRSLSRASWRRRICLGEATTSEPSAHRMSARHSAVPSNHGIIRSVSRSGRMTKSP